MKLKSGSATYHQLEYSPFRLPSLPCLCGLESQHADVLVWPRPEVRCEIACGSCFKALYKSVFCPRGKHNGQEGRNGGNGFARLEHVTPSARCKIALSGVVPGWKRLATESSIFMASPSPDSPRPGQSSMSRRHSHSGNPVGPDRGDALKLLRECSQHACMRDAQWTGALEEWFVGFHANDKEGKEIYVVEKDAARTNRRGRGVIA